MQIDQKGEIIDLDDDNRDATVAVRSIAVKDLINNRPSFLIRNGIFILLGIGCGLLAISWFIKYPETVSGKATLNSINAPEKIISRITGKLVRLFVAEDQSIKKNEVLGYIESTANHEEVLYLFVRLDSMNHLLDRERIDSALNTFPQKCRDLGPLQTDYQDFSSSILEFKDYLKNGFFEKKKAMLERDMEFLQRAHAEYLEEKLLMGEDLSLTDSTMQANHYLREQAVISSLDYRTERSKLISKQIGIPQLNISLINNESQQNEKKKEIAQLENDIRRQKEIFIQSLNAFKNKVADWKSKYVLSAPEEGRILFSTFVQEGQELKDGQLICYVNPGNSQYFAEVLVPQYNFGRLQVGQSVLLKFAAYQWREVGAVRGRIDFISSVSTDSGYIMRVSLPQGLQTNYDRSLMYRTGLTAEAEIITRNSRLAQRIFDELRSRAMK